MKSPFTRLSSEADGFLCFASCHSSMVSSQKMLVIENVGFREAVFFIVHMCGGSDIRRASKKEPPQF